MTPAEKKLEEVHVNLWEPHNPPSFFGNIYAIKLMYEKTRELWVLYLQSKDKFIDTIQIWLLKIGNKSSQLMKTLCVDRGEEFISIKLKDFCNKKGIALKYMIYYIYKENCLAERKWHIIITIKDSLFLDSRRLLDF